METSPPFAATSENSTLETANPFAAPTENSALQTLNSELRTPNSELKTLPPFRPLFSALDSSILLSSFRRLLQFLLEAEADYLCGVPLKTRSSPDRLNYRVGYHRRRFHTAVGSFQLRVPHLCFIHPRPSIVKRAKRLSPQILEVLARIMGRRMTPGATAMLPENGTHPPQPSALGTTAQPFGFRTATPPDSDSPFPDSSILTPTTFRDTASLIRLLWPHALPEALLTTLTGRFLPILAKKLTTPPFISAPPQPAALPA